MTWWGLWVFLSGCVLLIAGSKGERGWANWSRGQRAVCSAGLVLILVGLASGYPG
ncbi:hypothetical protein [Streptomyces sp. NPDC089915]|uniref:hypothetical protein n=1 Tax=Streptomyces sp. NPDC089915 TaxID=3155186 RepID=UPI00342678A9